MTIYDVAVVGGGAAGAMAAIRAGGLKKRVCLIEKNDSMGKKLLITGKGRCNITNSCSIDNFIEKFGPSGNFLRSAFFAFSNEDLMNFFQSQGLELKTERQGRVFPVTDNARSVLQVLKKCLEDNEVEVRYSTALSAIKIKDGIFILEPESGSVIKAKKVILSTGGVSYKATGSSGEGQKIAKELGHTVTPLTAGLVPLRTREAWVKELQGLALKNIRLKFYFGKKRIVSEIGEIIFTHFGISGPLVLDLSAKVLKFLDEYKSCSLFIDLKTGLEEKEIEDRILSDIRGQGSRELKNFLKAFLPSNLIPVFIKLLNVDPAKKMNQFTQEDRRVMAGLLKALPLTIVGSLPTEEAMVTVGGVSTKEINPRTMESKIVPGLYFAGEIIEGAASSGGYNLQQAFSTGYLAGEKAAECAE